MVDQVGECLATRTGRRAIRATISPGTASAPFPDRAFAFAFSPRIAHSFSYNSNIDTKFRI